MRIHVEQVLTTLAIACLVARVVGFHVAMNEYARHAAQESDPDRREDTLDSIDRLNRLFKSTNTDLRFDVELDTPAFTVAIVSVYFAIAAALLSLCLQLANVKQQYQLSVAAFALVASCLGFLYFAPITRLINVRSGPSYEIFAREVALGFNSFDWPSYFGVAATALLLANLVVRSQVYLGRMRQEVE